MRNIADIPPQFAIHHSTERAFPFPPNEASDPTAYDAGPNQNWNRVLGWFGPHASHHHPMETPELLSMNNTRRIDRFSYLPSPN